MPDVELVIKLSEKEYNYYKDASNFWGYSKLREIILNGTPLSQKVLEQRKQILDLESSFQQMREEIDNIYEDFDGYDPHALGAYASRVDEILDTFSDKLVENKDISNGLEEDEIER